MRLRLAIVGGLVLVALLAVSLYTLLSAPEAPNREASGTEAPGREASNAQVYPRLSIGLLPIIDSIPFIVADVEGLYAKYGLNVTLHIYGSARDRDSAFIAGMINVAVNDPITTLILADKGVDVRIIATLLGELPGDGVFYLLAPPDSTITVTELKRVAISRNTIIEFAAWTMLELLGVNPSDVEFIDVPSIPVRYQMLMEGRVEAAVLPDPWGSLALARGARLLASDDMFGRPITISVIVAKSDVASNRELVSRLVAVLNEALSLYKSNPEKYRRVIEERVFIPEELRGVWLPKWEGRITVYPRDNFVLVVKWLNLRGLISRVPSYDEVVVSVT